MENIFTLDVFLISLPIYLACIVGGYMLAIKPKRSKTKALSLSQELYDPTDDEVLKLEYEEDFDLYLSLAKMYRRAGEFDKSVKIHQKMLENEALTSQMRSKILLELGRDFFTSGMFNQAEEKFLACEQSLEKDSKIEEQCNIALSRLYERCLNWKKAVAYRENLAQNDEGHKSGLALLHCNLAKHELAAKNIGNAKQNYQKALELDKDCVLAVKELIDIALSEKDLNEVCVLIQNYINSSVRLVNLLVPAFEKLLANKKYSQKAMELLNQLVASDNCDYEISILYSNELFKRKEYESLQEFISMYIDRYKDSLQAIHALARFFMETKFEYKAKDKDNYSLLLEKIENMLKSEYNYQCGGCGYHTKQEFWYCPQCQKWNTLERIYR